MYFFTGLKKEVVRILYGFSRKKDKKFLRKKALAMIDKVYLERYLPVLDTLPHTEKLKQKSNIIWTCWFQGEEQAPDIVRACIQQMREMEENQKVIVISEQNMNKYVHIPDYIIKKWKEGKISNTHFSDILRVCLLYENGGTWIDATVYLMDKLPSEVRKADFFSYHSKTFLWKYPKVFGNNSWLISSCPQHPLMSGMRGLLFEYWKHENTLIHYFVYHLFFDLMVENRDYYKNLWTKVPVLYDDNEDLYLNLLKPFDEKLYNEIKATHPIQKLSYKYDSPKTEEYTFEKYIKRNLGD